MWYCYNTNHLPHIEGCRMPDHYSCCRCCSSDIWYVRPLQKVVNYADDHNVENGLITQSRLILLDSPLVAFTAFTALSWTCFTNQHEQGPEKAFEPTWWFCLSMTGLCLGATASVKWVGLFTIAWVGSLTILQLWVLLGDTTTITPVSNNPHSCPRYNI